MNRVAKLHYLQRTPAPLEIFSTHTSVIGLRRAWKTAQPTATVRTIGPFFVSNAGEIVPFCRNLPIALIFFPSLVDRALKPRGKNSGQALCLSGQDLCRDVSTFLGKLIKLTPGKSSRIHRVLDGERRLDDIFPRHDLLPLRIESFRAEFFHELSVLRRISTSSIECL